MDQSSRSLYIIQREAEAKADLSGTVIITIFQFSGFVSRVYLAAGFCTSLCISCLLARLIACVDVDIDIDSKFKKFKSYTCAVPSSIHPCLHLFSSLSLLIIYLLTHSLVHPRRAPQGEVAGRGLLLLIYLYPPPPPPLYFYLYLSVCAATPTTTIERKNMKTLRCPLTLLFKSRKAREVHTYLLALPCYVRCLYVIYIIINISIDEI